MNPESKVLHDVKERLEEGIEPPRRKPASSPRSIRGRIVAGVILIIPLSITAFLISYVYEAILGVGIYLVNGVAYFSSIGLNWAFATQLKLDPELIKSDKADWYIKLSAVVLTLMMLYVLGWLGSNVLGRTIIEFFEGLLERIPLVDTVYGAIKRMVHSLSGGTDGAKRVVLIDFPTEKMKAIAFQTNVIIDRTTGRKYATVFVPTTPNPTSGYMEFVPLEDITETDWTMEEALSMILSGGAKAPEVVYLRQPARSDGASRRPVPLEMPGPSPV